MTVVSRPGSTLTFDTRAAINETTFGNQRKPSSLMGWLGIAVVFAVVFELTCRIEDWVMYRMPILSPYHSVEDLLVRDADGMHGRPNAQFQKWVMNELGTRGRPAQIVPTPGVIRIIAVGASETFGLSESPNHEFPRQLEDSLNRQLALTKCGDTSRVRFEVLNAAFAGMTMPTIEQDVRKRLSRFRPSMIVAYIPSSAYLEEVAPIAATPDTTRRLAPTLGLRSVIRPRGTERIRDQAKGLLPELVKTWLRRIQTAAVVRAHDASWRFTTPPVERLSAFDADLRRLVGTIRAIGATPVLVTHGNAFMGRAAPDKDKLIVWEKFYPRATAATLVEFDSLVRLDVLRVAADSNTVSVDAASALTAVPETAFADPTHFTDLGAAVVAHEISRSVFAITPTVQACLGH